MNLTINRAPDQRWTCAGSMFFAARTVTGDAVTIDVSEPAWETIRKDYPDDPCAKVEQMAASPTAHAADFGADKVWRVYL